MRTGLLLIALLLTEALAASIPAISEDGWYRWQVEDPEGGHVYCWRRDYSYVRKCEESDTAAAVYIYARSRDGEIVDIRIRSLQCGDDMNDEYRELGIVANADSIAWLKTLAEANERASEDATAAIAAHASEQALPVLIALVENRRLDHDVREQALFWLAQSDDDEAFDYLDKLLADR